MGDFYQNGIITTLHNLSQRPVEALEQELLGFSRRRPLGLILPSLYSELEGVALPRIVDELAHVPYLGEIVIGLDRADREQYAQAVRFFSRLPQRHRILWNDGPRLQQLDAQLDALDLAPRELGKGRNVWYCMGYTLASGRTESVALHDCDIVTYDRSLLARLIYPVAHPRFNYEFCKGFYARVADGKINGRVSRLLVTPLLRTVPDFWSERDLAVLAQAGRVSRDPDEPEGPHTVAVAAVQRLAPAAGGAPRRDARVVVVGNANFATNASVTFPGHVNFLLNAFAWLSESEELIAIRPSGLEQAPLVLTETQERLITWTASLATLQAVLLAGGLMWWRRRREQ